MSAPGVYAQGSRVGDTFYPRTTHGDNTALRFPSVAYDARNDAYLVTWTRFKRDPDITHEVWGRFVSGSGASLGTPVMLSNAPGGAARSACAPAANRCLVAWIQEPSAIIGRFVSYSGGNVAGVSNPFVVNANGRGKHTAAPPTVAYSSATNEFLVAWADFGNSLDVRAQRVGVEGTLAGPEIQAATTGLYESFPSLTYNSAANEFFLSHYQEVPATSVGVKRIQPGTGAILGGGTLLASAFDTYPEITYNSTTNQYLVVTWGLIPGGWMLHGQLADASGQPAGAPLSLAAAGGGDGIGVTYNPVSNSYFAVYQSLTNNEVWGVTVGPTGVPTAQFQVTASAPRLSSATPQAASSTKTKQFVAAAVPMPSPGIAPSVRPWDPP